KEISNYMNGKIIQSGNNILMDHVVTDSRQILSGNNSLFIALNGLKYDGHDFVTSAYNLGVRNFIVKEGYFNLPVDANILTVPDTIDALQKIAQWHRSLFQHPVIGITGSNGKTIV